MADKTYKNILDDGYTTYHDDGTKSRTYKNVLDDGVTTYHEDGSKTVTYKNVLDDGYTSYHTPAPGANKQSQPVVPPEPISPPKPKVNEPWKRAGSYDSVKPAELKNLGSVPLNKTRARQFAWYAADQLKKSNVPFSDKAQGERYWTLKYNVENETKTDFDREDYSYDVLTENGFYRNGDVRLFYNYKSSTRPVEKARDNWNDAEPFIPYIDLFLKKNNIELSSAKFSKMSQDEIDDLTNWEKVYAVQEKVVKRREKKLKDDSIESSMRWNAPSVSFVSNWIFIAIWMILGALCSIWGDVKSHGYLVLALTIVGTYFMTRQSEKLALKTCAGVFCFSLALLWFQTHGIRTSILVLACVAMAVTAGYIIMYKLNDYGRKTIDDYICIVAFALLGVALLTCVLKMGNVGVWITIVLILLLIVTAVLSIVQFIKSVSGSKTSDIGQSYWRKKRLIAFGVSFGLVVVLVLLSKVFAPVIAGIIFLIFCAVAGAVLTKRTDSKALMVNVLMTFPTVAMLCLMALCAQRSFDNMLGLAGDMNGLIHVPIIQPIMSLILSLVEWVGGLMEFAVSCVAEVFSAVAGLASFTPDWLLWPDVILWCGISWLLAFLFTIVGVYAGYLVSKGRK